MTTLKIFALLGLVSFHMFNAISQTSLTAISGQMVLVNAEEYFWRGLPTKLPNDYLVSKFEVTQGLWEEVSGFNPSYTIVGPKYPVDNMSWYDCIVFCNQLSERLGLKPCYYSDEAYTQVYGRRTDGSYEYLNQGNVVWNRVANGYRMPMEAEWDYAARGGKYSKGTVYAGSNNLDEVGWYIGNNSPNGQKQVGQKLPNELGLFDMSGNGFEWCYDWYFNDRVCTSDPPDQVYKSGLWYYDAILCKIEHRSYFPANWRIYVSLRLFRNKP